MEQYELDDLDRELIEKLRDAIDYSKNGDPIKDVVDERDLIEGVKLLLEIVDSGAAA